jgi:hypothetical protein
VKLLLPLLFAALAALPAAAHFEATPFPKVVQGGVPVGGLVSTEPHGLVVYKVTVPEGTARLVVTTAGGSGNLQLYVRRGAHPTYNGGETDHASRYPGTRQSIQAAAPGAGVWYVGLQGVHGGYRGVRLLVQTLRQKGALAEPALLPPPGIFPGNAAVTLKSRTRGTTVRYTLDGSDPHAGSPAAPAVLTLTADAIVKARVFTAAGAAGPVAEGLYQVHAPGEIRLLENAQAVHHLAAAKGGRHLFRIPVDAGQRLSIFAEGGKGKSMIVVRHGSAPNPGIPPRGDTAHVRGPARVVIPETTAGDYFIALDATTAFSGRSLLAIVSPDGPDLMPWAQALQPYVSVEEFSEVSCEVQEGLIGAGQRRLLRYNTEVRNTGSQDLVMPPPEGNPFFEYHDCHGHFHFKGFAASRLLDLEGTELRTGRKVSFCLLDNIRWDRGAAVRGRYNCASQGIQAGWGDVYDSGLPGQWIELGDLPAGDYQLELTVNPDGILPDANAANNTVRIPVSIPAP